MRLPEAKQRTFLSHSCCEKLTPVFRFEDERADPEESGRSESWWIRCNLNRSSWFSPLNYRMRCCNYKRRKNSIEKLVQTSYTPILLSVLFIISILYNRNLNFYCIT